MLNSFFKPSVTRDSTILSRIKIDCTWRLVMQTFGGISNKLNLVD